MGRYKVPHFDAKWEANQAFVHTGVPTTFLLTSFYWDNLIHLGMGPKRGEDGTLAITMPMGSAKLPGIAADSLHRVREGIRVDASGQHREGVPLCHGLPGAGRGQVACAPQEQQLHAEGVWDGLAEVTK